MKKSFIIICMVTLSEYLSAQGIASFEGSKSTASVFLKKVVPPSPTAASLGKYGDQPINLFNGTTMVNIPICEIQIKGMTIPLSLNYSGSGLKVTESASWVGLGWSLNGTGVLTRIVKGIPDGVNNYHNIRVWPLPWSYFQPNDNAWNYIHSQLQGAAIDPEPDMYIIKAGSLNVKFYYDLHKRIQTIPYNNNIKIKYDAAMDQYIITDDDGTQYYFGGIQSTEITNSTNPSYAAYTSSWFLSKIITSLGGQILYNNSKGTSFIKQDQYSETEEIKMNGQGGDCAIPKGAGRSMQWSVQDIFPVFLNSIETDQEIVYLIRDQTERADMPGDYPLIGIKVYAKSSGKYEFNYSFSYSYFPQVSEVCWGDPNVFPPHVHNHTAVCKRLRLDQFIEKGAEENTTGYKTYQFAYSPQAVPSRCSLDQDFWGYYNGAGNTSLLPAVTDPDFQVSSYRANSREANHTYAEAGMLQKIIYPTGGETHFVYEPNEVNAVVPGQPFQKATATLSGIGPALESSVLFSIQYAQPFTIDFTLSDPNLPDQGLQRKIQILDQQGKELFFAFNSNSGTGGIVDWGLTGTGAYAPGTYTLKLTRNYSYNNYPSIPPVGLIATVTYRTDAPVTVTNRKIGAFRIKKVFDKTGPSEEPINVKEYFYENPYFITNINNSDCLSQYTRWNVNASRQPYKCYFKSRNITSVQPIGNIQGFHIAYGKVTCSYGANGSNGKTVSFYSTESDQGGYSLQPYYRPITSYDHRRGNLIKQIVYDAAGNMVKVSATDYENVLKYAGLFSYPYYTKDEPLPDLYITSMLPQKEIAFADYALPSEWVRIKHSTETIFQGSNYISTIREFSYDNPNYSYVTKTKTINSKGEEIAAYSKYPLDYKPEATLSNEEIERKFDTDYKALLNNFFSCDNAAPNSTGINNCYLNYQSGYDNLLTNRATALSAYRYSFITLANGTTDQALKAIYKLIAKNELSALIESTVTKDPATELKKSRNDYQEFTGNILLQKNYQSFLGNALVNQISYDLYDSYGNLLHATPKDGVSRNFIWDYQSTLPIAEIANADYSDLAYTSFESEGKGQWAFSGTPVADMTAPTGKNVYSLAGGNLTKAIANTATYIISYWRPINEQALNIAGTQIGFPVSGKTVNGWKYYEHQVSGQPEVTLSGMGLIDEVRLYPRSAQMQTYTYKPLIGKTSDCDMNNRITYYEYDGFGRLALIRDQDRKILKSFEYKYHQ